MHQFISVLPPIWGMICTRFRVMIIVVYYGRHRGCKTVRNVVLSISDGELAGAIGRTLQDAGQFKVYRSYASTLRELLTTCKIMRAELLLMDVKDKPGLTVPERLAAVEAVRGQLPSCRMVFFFEDEIGRAHV